MLQTIMTPYEEYFKEFLQKQMSPTLLTGLDIFFNNIVVAFEREHNRQRATTKIIMMKIH